MDKALECMSLTDRIMEAVKIDCDKKFNHRTKENQKVLDQKKNELEEINTQLHTMDKVYC